MFKVGLTGNRYSGKDTVASLFNKISIPVFDADVIVKFLINHNFEMDYKIKNKIDKSFFKNDQLDLSKLTGPILDQIIDIVEYELFDAYKKYQLKNTNSIYTVFHSSILFERDWNKKMDYSISVFSPVSDRVERCQEISDYKLTDIYNLCQREMKDLSKNSLSDFVIHNYNDDINPFGDILTQVNKIDQKIIDKYLSVAIDGTNYVRKFINELKEVDGQFEVTGGTEWQRNYKMLAIGLGDKSEYVDFISEHISDNRTLEESKNLIKFIIEKLSEKEIEDIFSKIKIDI